MLEPMTRSRLILLAVVVTAGAQLGCDDDDDLVGPGLPVSVYTRNLYLGSDLTPLIGAGSPEGIPGEAAKIWANIQASDFPERAKVLAADIVEAAPDLVALQEVSLYRQQVPSDISPGNTAANAEEVVLDFLALLMAEIDARGGGYRVVGEAINADAELPVADAQGGVYDLRLTDRDVILARDTTQTGYFDVDHVRDGVRVPRRRPRRRAAEDHPQRQLGRRRCRRRALHVREHAPRDPVAGDPHPGRAGGRDDEYAAGRARADPAARRPQQRPR